jgi:tetratricopeptide (TPR) repeat protein
MRAILLAATLASALSGWAKAQSMDQQWAWCRGRDPEKLIRACSAIIHAGRESPENLARAFFDRGRALSDEAHYEQAIQDFDRAIKLDPNYPDAFNSRALAYAGLGDHDRTIADFDEAIRLDPNYAIAIFNRGLALQTMGRADEAARDFARAKDVGARLTSPKE